jgi:hypothetical protein
MKPTEGISLVDFCRSNMGAEQLKVTEPSQAQKLNFSTIETRSSGILSSVKIMGMRVEWVNEKIICLPSSVIRCWGSSHRLNNWT